MEDTYGHDQTANADVRTQSLPNTSRFVERSKPDAVLAFVYPSRHYLVGVGASADYEQEDQQCGLEVEDCGLAVC